MPQILFTVAIIAYLYMLRRLIQQRLGLPEIIVMLLLIALTMDNLILVLGNAFIDTTGYYYASWFRFFAHALVLPLLMQAVLAVAARAGVTWAARRDVQIITGLIVVAAILFGMITEVIGLQLVEAELMGHLRLVSADAHPPFATIFTNIVVLLVAIPIWRRAGWPWLFAGSLAIFLINGAAGATDYGILAGNAAEILFAACWVATLYRFPVSD